MLRAGFVPDDLKAPGMISKEQIAQSIGIEGNNLENAAVLVFSIQRNRPNPQDFSASAFVSWQLIIAEPIRDITGVDSRSIRAATLAYELHLTTAALADAGYAVAGEKIANLATTESSRRELS